MSLDGRQTRSPNPAVQIDATGDELTDNHQPETQRRRIMRTKFVQSAVRRRNAAPVEASRRADVNRPNKDNMTLEALTRPAQTRSLKAVLRQK